MFFILFIYLSSIPDGTHYLPLPQLGNGSPVRVVLLLRHSGHTYAASNKLILSPLQGSKQTRDQILYGQSHEYQQVRLVKSSLPEPQHSTVLHREATLLQTCFIYPGYYCIDLALYIIHL